MTVRQYINSITNSIKAYTSDSWISPKLIYNLSQQAIADFLKKDNSASRLTYKLIAGWTEIPNLPFIEVDVTECNLGVDRCQKLMRSKYPLPAMYESKFGGIIKQVLSLNLQTEYTNIFSPKQWIATTKREFGNQRYFFFINNYLYIPVKKASEGSPEIVRIEAYFKDKFEVAQLLNKINESCEDCKANTEVCKKRLEYEMVIPTHLENDVKNFVITSLANTYLKIPTDTYPNINSNDVTNQRDLQNTNQK